MNNPLKLLAIFPHPDDETLGLGSTLARYSAEGVETHLVCATHGEMGWFDSEGPNPGFEGVGLIRTEELNCAAQHLGLHAVNFLDYVDGYVDRAKPAEIIGKLVVHIRHIKPQVVVTFAPDGAYGHPDHIALSQFTNGALICAADKSFADADKQPPHRVSKFYYMVDSVDIVGAANEAFGGISMDVDGVTRHQMGWENWQITTVLNNKKYMVQVQRAIRCHKSQLPGYGPIAEWSLDELNRVFGVGSFYRTYSLVNGGRKVETDLFEGIRE
jgi:LmbE family N-acetylglucosaminyl deacetylase